MCQLALAMLPQHIVVFSLDSGTRKGQNPRQEIVRQAIRVSRHSTGDAKARRSLGENDMQFLPGFTVQCINPQCSARGHWLRADATRVFCDEGRCPCCGDSLRNVPPPLGPRFRMRPRPLTARPPLRPRPR